MVKVPSRARRKACDRAACIKVKAGDGPRRVDALGVGFAGARRIEAGEGASGRPQEAVTYTACVQIGSCDGPGWIDWLARKKLKPPQ